MIKKYGLQFKNAFTLAEILLVFVVMGIICVLGFITVKPYEKAASYTYYRAYKTLSDAGQCIANDLGYKNELIPKAPKDLCEKLIEYINTSKTNCNATELEITDDMWTNGLPKNISDQNYLQFVATNGMRFYITKTYEIDDSAKTDTKFNLPAGSQIRFIIVDIDGEKGENKAIEAGGKYYDLVAFAMNEFGEISPIGNPTVNRIYLSGIVKYPNASDITYSSTYSFKEAKCIAWNDAFISGNLFTYNYDEIVTKGPFMTPAPACVNVADTTHGCQNGSASECIVEVYKKL